SIMSNPPSRRRRHFQGPIPIGLREGRVMLSHSMIAAVDVHYGDDAVVAACVLFADWQDAAAVREIVASHAPDAAPYEPGAFYRRELPYLRAILADVGATTIVIDGYAWLGVGRPGLGGFVHDALGVPA